MSKTVEILGEQAGYYLSHVCRTIDKKSLYLPGPDTVERIWTDSDRNIRTLGSLRWILSNGRLGGTGYVSILPVDQGIEHSAGASFAPNPAYFDPENIVKLAAAMPWLRPSACSGPWPGNMRTGYRSSSSSTTTSCFPIPTPTTRSCSARCAMRGTWAPRPSGPRSISVRSRAAGSWSRSPAPSTRRMNWAWRRSCGVTCATRDSKRRASITMPRPTSRGRPTIWA